MMELLYKKNKLMYFLHPCQNKEMWERGFLTVFEVGSRWISYIKMEDLEPVYVQKKFSDIEDNEIMKKYTEEEWKNVKWDTNGKAFKSEDQQAVDWFLRAYKDMKEMKSFCIYMGWGWKQAITEKGKIPR